MTNQNTPTTRRAKVASTIATVVILGGGAAFSVAGPSLLGMQIFVKNHVEGLVDGEI